MQAWSDTVAAGVAVEPEMWTFRTLLPCAAFLVNPLLLVKCLDGEMKGADSALAQRARQPVQIWPFYAVLEPPVREQLDQPCPSGIHYKGLSLMRGLASSPLSDLALFVHLLGCRCGNGFFEVARHPENSRWNLF